MVDILITGVINWFHVISVVGWFGGALTFLVSIRPSLGKLSSQAGGEFMVKVLPRFVKSIQVFSVLTVIFGPLLAYTMNDGPPNVFDFVSPWSRFVTAGASLGIATLIVVFFLLTPTANGLVRIISQMQKSPQQPPPAELKALQKRMALIPPLGVSLLLLAEACMVAAAQF